MDQMRAWVAGSITEGADDLTDNWQTMLEAVSAFATELPSAGDDPLTTEDIWKWQALGVVFGDAIVQFVDLEWAEYADEHGSDPCVVVDAARDLVMFPMSMLSKRAERGEELNRAGILTLFEGVTTTALQEKPED